MHSLPDELSHLFNAALDKGQPPENIKDLYRKWLRYYWDFCHKYHHDPFQQSSLPLFLKKLEQKKQTDQQREQAHRALVLFYRTQAKANNTKVEKPTQSFLKQTLPSPDVPPQELASEPSKSIPRPLQQTAPHEKQQQSLSDVNAQQEFNPKRQTGCSWVTVFDGLTKEIKLRHYSPKTLKSYRGWVRHLQTFTQSKDYQALTQQDVVAFLSYLAVEKKVSASSQNQAFNALLFLFKQVLQKDFGNIQGVEDL